MARPRPALARARVLALSLALALALALAPATALALDAASGSGGACTAEGSGGDGPPGDQVALLQQHGHRPPCRRHPPGPPNGNPAEQYCTLTDWCATDYSKDGPCYSSDHHSCWTCYPNCEKCDWSGTDQWTRYCGGDTADVDVWPLTCDAGHCNTCEYYPDDTGTTWCNNFEGRQREISCTPFPVQYTAHATPDNSDWCKTSEIGQYASWSGTDGGSAQAWMCDGCDNFWVFHGCDGAGTQMGDCGGGALYVENFGARCEWGKEDCAFRHPGTGTAYKTYLCGWWTMDNQWADRDKPWWKTVQGMGVTSPSDSPQTALLYPWEDAYQKTGQDLSWYWGGNNYGTSDGAGNKWLEPVGYVSGSDKYICNNEPESGGHWDSGTPPKSLNNHYGAWKLWGFDGANMKVTDAFSGAEYTLVKMRYVPW